MKTGANIEWTCPWDYVAKGLDLGIKHVRYHITGDATSGNQVLYEKSLFFLADALKQNMGIFHGRADVTVALMATPPDPSSLPQIWRVLAQKFLGVPGVFGLDILNEPRLTAPEWRVLASETIREIKKVGRLRCIVQTRRGEPGRLRELEGVPADMLSVHVYSPMSWSHQGLYSYPAPKALDISKLRSCLSNLKDNARIMAKPIYVGEFSGVINAPGANRWLKEAIDTFERCDFHSAYHAWCQLPAPWSAECEDRLELLKQYWRS